MRDAFGYFRPWGARHEAERLGVPFLGEVPLHIDIREKSDAGLPVVATDPDGQHAKTYRGIAAKVRESLASPGVGRRHRRSSLRRKSHAARRCAPLPQPGAKDILTTHEPEGFGGEITHSP